MQKKIGKKFNKISFLKKVGFLVKKFDGINFHRSFTLQITSILILILSTSALYKCSIALLFDSDDKIQFFIGDYKKIIFFYLDGK